MESIKQFIVDNWQFISFGLVLLFELLILIIKKRPVRSIVDNSVTNQLIPLIEQAEQLFTQGKDKMNYVLSTYIANHPEMIDFKDIIEEAVEVLLKLPTKKGGYGRESK